jgi:hypothetical protein
MKETHCYVCRRHTDTRCSDTAKCRNGFRLFLRRRSAVKVLSGLDTVIVVNCVICDRLLF